jgi:hypothetical protein
MRPWHYAVVLALVTGSAGCGRFGPSCSDEEGTVLTSNGVVGTGEIATATVRSPKSSNLVLHLRWDGDARLGLRATITDCGGHTGCAMLTVMPSFGPGGPSPIPQPWPLGYVQMLVDGWIGKTYRVEIIGATDRETAYRLEVRYLITCES